MAGAAFASIIASQLFQPQNIQRQPVFNEQLVQTLRPQPRVLQGQIVNTAPQGLFNQVNPFQLFSQLLPGPQRGQDISTRGLVDTLNGSISQPRVNNQLTGSEINVGRLPGPRI